MPLLSKKTEEIPTLWTATNDADGYEQFIVKEPSINDDQKLGWPLFQHEHRMQKLFHDSIFIRKMVDYIPSEYGGIPKIVLEAFEQTMWAARSQRPMTNNEVKWIMKAVLLGIWTVHRKGLVYSDLKMEDVMLDGFGNEGAGNLKSIIIRLADCGAIPSPSCQRITSLIYRSPEVYCSKEWTTSTDIWSWESMYCHLLEAQVDFSNPGLYDSICSGSLEAKTKAVLTSIAFDFDLYSIPFYAEDERVRSLLPSGNPSDTGGEIWYERLARKGVADVDIAFLFQVLNPDPVKRCTAMNICSCGYLELD